MMETNVNTLARHYRKKKAAAINRFDDISVLTSVAIRREMNFPEKCLKQQKSETKTSKDNLN
jgi:hypothetical protein